MTTDWPDLVKRHGRAVWSTAWRLLRSAEEAEDCFQRTFLCAWELSRREPIRDWTATLRNLAIARALDQIRAKTRESSRSVPTEPDSIPDHSSASPVPSAQLAELGNALRDVLASLEPNQATAFALVAIESASYREVAEQLGIQESYVGVLVHRARKELHRRLSRFEPDRRANESKMEQHP